jgi:hypothetical protein
MTRDDATEFSLLQSEPTVERWAIELERVLRGERDFVIEHLGSAAEYAADLVRRATDPATSAVHLIRALEQRVSAWTPSHNDTSAFRDKLLDLVQHFAPSSGFARVLQLLEYLRLPDEQAEPGAVHGLGQDVRLKALHALESYFRAPPVRPSEGKVLEPSVVGARQATFDVQMASFKLYRDVLWDHISYEKYAPYATRVLLQLGVLSPDDGSLRSLIARQPMVLRGVLDWCFSAPNRDRGERSLRAVYMQCLRSEQDTLEPLFYEEVIRTGAKMKYLGAGPYISTTGRHGAREYLISMIDGPSELYLIYHYDILMNRVNQNSDQQLNQSIDLAASEHSERGLDNQ